MLLLYSPDRHGKCRAAMHASCCVFLALLAIRFRFSSPNALEPCIQRLSRLLVHFLCCEVPVTVSARSRCLRCASPSWRSLAPEAVPADWARLGIDGYAREQEKWQAFCPTDWPTRTEEAEKFGDFVFVIRPGALGNLCFSFRGVRRFCSVLVFSFLSFGRVEIIRKREGVVSSPGWLKTAWIFARSHNPQIQFSVLLLPQGALG
jgi:hypothetical protein